jgi:hypothetical protein
VRVPVSARLREAADDWGERRLAAGEDPLETKIEQALLEVEHLASGATDVAFELSDGEVVYEPSAELARLLDAQAEEGGVAPATVLGFYLDLCARVYLDEDGERPPNAPPSKFE